MAASGSSTMLTASPWVPSATAAALSPTSGSSVGPPSHKATASTREAVTVMISVVRVWRRACATSLSPTSQPTIVSLPWEKASVTPVTRAVSVRAKLCALVASRPSAFTADAPTRTATLNTEFSITVGTDSRAIVQLRAPASLGGSGVKMPMRATRRTSHASSTTTDARTMRVGSAEPMTPRSSTNKKV